MTVLTPPDHIPRGAGRPVLRHPKVRVGLAVFALLLAGAVAHPLLVATIWAGQESVYGPETGHDRDLEHPTGPSSAHLLGTDALGRDVLSTLTFSLAPALQVAVLAALLVGLLSITIGSIAAYFRGWVDLVITCLADAAILLPPAIALLVVGIGKPAFGMLDAGLLFGMLYGFGPAALVIRSRALSVIEKPFIDAARVAGAGPIRIIRTQMLPHLLPYAGIQMMGAGHRSSDVSGFHSIPGSHRQGPDRSGIDDLHRDRRPAGSPDRIRNLQHGGLPCPDRMDLIVGGRRGDDSGRGGVLSRCGRE